MAKGFKNGFIMDIVSECRLVLGELRGWMGKSPSD